MEDDLLAVLPPLSRLALAYSPAASRADWLTLLTLDARLATLIRQAREPVLAQIRLAWWRDRLQQAITERPRGEPLLARLSQWQDGGRALVALVDGWEALIGEPPLGVDAFESFVRGRIAAVAALADRIGGDPVVVNDLSRRWALADLVLHLAEPEERDAVGALLKESAQPGGGVMRSMRPILVLERVSARAASRGSLHALTSPGALFTAIGAGLFGR